MSDSVAISPLDTADALSAEDMGRVNFLLDVLSSHRVGLMSLRAIALLLAAGNTVFLARDMAMGGRIVGLAELVPVRTLGGSHAEIQSVVVDQHYRKQGIGAALTRAIIARARQDWTLRHLYLTSKPARVAANQLYLRLGFTLSAKADHPDGTSLYYMSLSSD